MTDLVLLSIPGLRRRDLSALPAVQQIADGGQVITLDHHFPAMTWPSQANMLTGCLPDQHGVTANGFFWRDENRVEMWTAWNEKIEKPQIWDRLKVIDSSLTTAAWFPMLSKGCGADYVCMPAPIHQPDGSEDLWCYTKPQAFYGDLLETLGHFPLQHFWGPLANIKSSQWIVDSAVRAAREFQPNFFYIYLPHLDYAAQKSGPDSPQARTALSELDSVIAQLREQLTDVYGKEIGWMALSEYTIEPVNHVVYPNRVLREAGFLTTIEDDQQKERIDFSVTPAWALVDHQLAHVFVRERDQIERIASLFKECEGIEHVFCRDELGRIGLDHPRSGEIVLVSRQNSWQAYYWWTDDGRAPAFAQTVDIHQKPGYDPVELFFDMNTKSVPLDASLVKGSHGRGIFASDSARPESEGVLLTNLPNLTTGEPIVDTDIYRIVLDQFRP